MRMKGMRIFMGDGLRDVWSGMFDTMCVWAEKKHVYLQTNNEELHRSRSVVLYEEVKRDRNVRVIDEGREMVVRFAVEVTDRFKLEDGLHTESMFSPFLEGHAGRQDPTRASVVYAVCRWHCDLLQEYRASQEDPGEYILWGKKTPWKSGQCMNEREDSG